MDMHTNRPHSVQTQPNSQPASSPAAVQPVVQQVGGPVCQQAVALHLPKANASTHLAPLDGLTRQLVHLACGANLVVVGGKCVCMGKEGRRESQGE